jgi:hypothetical protein
MLAVCLSNHMTTSSKTVNWTCVLDSDIKLSTTVLHDVKLHRWDLGPAWQAGCHAQAPYGAGPHQGVCSMAVAEYVRGMVAGAPLIKTGWKSGRPRRGMGKVPSSLGRRAYLSRTCTTRRAKSCRSLQEATYVGWASHGPTLHVHMHMWHMCLCTGIMDASLYYI